MFSQTFVQASSQAKPWSMLLSFSIQIVGVAILLIIPLLFTESLPAARWTHSLALPPPPAPPAPPAVQTAAPKVVPRNFDGARLLTPVRIPEQVAVLIEEVLTVATGSAHGVPNAVPGGTGSALLGSMLDKITADPPKPPAPPKPEVPKQTRVSVNSGVQAARLIHKVMPIYPQLAKSARISGTVRFTAIISADGRIQNLQLVSGHPLLITAAQEAVRQWIYKPTLLSGVPVEVVTQIDVNFVLSQ